MRRNKNIHATEEVKELKKNLYQFNTQLDRVEDGAP